tara:strand:+ start:3660 stop:3818 length:159 start_codon:yes stop_codon:yes gene_type:complete
MVSFCVLCEKNYIFTTKGKIFTTKFTTKKWWKQAECFELFRKGLVATSALSP